MRHFHKWIRLGILMAVMIWLSGVSVPEVQADALKTWRQHSAAVHAVAFSPSGQTLASGSEDKTVKLWDVRTRQLRRTLKGPSTGVRTIAFSPDGGMLAAGCKDEIWLWNSRSGERLRVLQLGEAEKKTQINGVAFSPDGKTLASGSRADGGVTGSVILWDVASGRQKQTLSENRGYITAVTFSPDGRHLAAGLISSDVFGGGVNIWDLETMKRESTWTEEEEVLVNSLAYSPNGKLLATGGGYFEGAGRVSVWDAQSGRLKWARSFTDWASDVAFSPNGDYLAVGTSYETTYTETHDAPGGDIKIFKVATGNWQRSLEQHRDGIYAVVFSPDGKLLATGSKDKSVKLWRFPFN